MHDPIVPSTPVAELRGRRAAAEVQDTRTSPMPPWRHVIRGGPSRVWLGSPLAASAADARKKPFIGPLGACTTNATASVADSLRIVCGLLPANGTTSPDQRTPATTRA
jgi:hypothetical protein